MVGMVNDTYTNCLRALLAETSGGNTQGAAMKTAKRNEQIRKTVKAWREMGLAFTLHYTQLRTSGGGLRCVQRVVIGALGKGEYITFGEFARRYPYGANPST